jgi:hypothetical protein
MAIKRLVYSEYTNSNEFWNALKVLASFKDEMEIVFDDELEENIPANVKYLLKEARKKDLLVIEGGCCLIDSMEYDIHYKEFEKNKIKTPQKIEVEAINAIFKNSYNVLVYLDDDAKIALKLCLKK